MLRFFVLGLFCLIGAGWIIIAVGLARIFLSPSRPLWSATENWAMLPIQEQERRKLLWNGHFFHPANASSRRLMQIGALLFGSSAVTIFVLAQMASAGWLQ